MSQYCAWDLAVCVQSSSNQTDSGNESSTNSLCCSTILGVERVGDEMVKRSDLGLFKADDVHAMLLGERRSDVALIRATSVCC